MESGPRQQGGGTAGTVKPDYKADHVTHGGYFEDLPKPWVFRFGPGSPLKRQVNVSVHRYYGIGQHYWVSIDEEDNYIWDAKEKVWRHPWGKTKTGEDDWQNGKLIKGQLFSRPCLSIALAKSYVRHTLNRFFPETTHEVSSDWEKEFNDEIQPGGTYTYPDHD